MTATTTNKELHENAQQMCVSSHLRYTETRRKILETLSKASCALDIEQVVANTKGLAQSSAYRNIEELRKAGLIAAMAVASEPTKYELSDQLAHHHHHLICSSCSSVSDFELSGDAEEKLHSWLEAVSKKQGFSMTGHSLDIGGMCSACS